MKKSSKLISLILALVLATSCFAGFSAFTASAADEDTKIYFKVPELEAWGTASSCFAHIYNVYGDESLASMSFNSRGQRCTYDADKGMWAFDTAKKLYELEDPTNPKSKKIYRPLKDGCDYGLIFGVNNKEGATLQTCDLTFSTECLGGSVVVTGNLVENTMDSQKMDYEAVWNDAELATKYGPKANITSTGRIVGQYFPIYQPKAQIVSQFLNSFGVKNASILTPEIVQNVCKELGVEPMDVYNQYATDYADQLADPETYTNTASLEAIATYLGVDPNAETTAPETTEPETTEPVTTEPTRPEEKPTFPTAPETTEPVTTEPVTTIPVLGIYGDVNKDSVVNVMDATDIQKAGLDIITFDELTTVLGDVNADGRISILDVTYVQKYAVGAGYNTKLVGQPYYG